MLSYESNNENHCPLVARFAIFEKVQKELYVLVGNRDKNELFRGSPFPRVMPNTVAYGRPNATRFTIIGSFLRAIRRPPKKPWSTRPCRRPSASIASLTTAVRSS